ncbi:MAG TPA: nuclear transport factor 2 family protein [Stellaceae bacterium]|nr:nuclear transport factor 2 family protein [Stellaceae bacterium]
MENFDPIAFSREWASAWNRRDVEAVLEHFDDDALFTSPVARKIGFAEDGVVRGKAALRRYWQSALDNNPGLHFQVTAVFAGVDAIAIRFTTQEGTDRIEFLKFRDGLVIEGHGTFAAS